MTMEELKLLEEDFERNSLSFNSDLQLLFKERLLIQALLVMRRIFTQANLGHPHWLYLESLLKYDRPTVCEKIVLNIYLFILEQLNGFDPKLLSRRSFDVFMTTINDFSFFFSFVGLYDPAHELITFDNLLELTKFIVTISEFFPNPAMISSATFHSFHFAEIVYRFLCILEKISSRITDQEKHQLEEYFSYFIRNFFPERTTTVLHWAAKEVKILSDLFIGDDDLHESLIPYELEPYHTRIKLILQLGADPNAINRESRTPLHILAEIKEDHLNEYLPVFQTLVDAGSQLYLADDYGETVISILRGFAKRDENGDEIPSQHYFESLINSDVFPLTCLCARVIRRHRIPYKDRFPLTLQKLVSI